MASWVYSLRYSDSDIVHLDLYICELKGPRSVPLKTSSKQWREGYGKTTADITVQEEGNGSHCSEQL